MSLLDWLRRLFGRPPLSLVHRRLALQLLTALGKARERLPGDPVIEQEYRRIEDVVRRSGQP